MPDVIEVVTRTIAQLAKYNAEEINMETRIAEDLMLKSVSRIELAALLENRLEVSITNFEIRKPKTVGEIVAMVKAKL